MRGVGLVLAHEAVLDPAGGPAGERAREGRWPALAQRLPVRGRGGRLGGEHERRAELGRGGAGRQHGRHAASGGDAAGGHERQLGHGAHELE